MDVTEGTKRHLTYNLNPVNQLITEKDITDLINGLLMKLSRENRKYNPHSPPIVMFKVWNIEHYQKAFINKSFVLEQNQLQSSGDMEELEKLKANKEFDKLTEKISTEQFNKSQGEIVDWIESGKDTIGYVPKETNEMLEFLGDAYLKAIEADYLYFRLVSQPNVNEGLLTKLRIKLEKTERLAEWSKFLGFDKWLLINSFLESQEKRHQGRNNPKLLENLFEAFLGAIVRDYAHAKEWGYYYCYYFVSAIIEQTTDFAKLVLKNDNFKDSIIRYFAEQKWDPAENLDGKRKHFEELYHSGQTNNRTFTMVLCVQKDHVPKESITKVKEYEQSMRRYIAADRSDSVNERLTRFDEILKTRHIIGMGKERSKVQAEQMASKKALINLGVSLNY